MLILPRPRLYDKRGPFSLRLYVCAVTLGGGRWPVLPFDPISLVLAQRNGVEPPKKSAFLPRRLHHSRERSCLGGRDVPRPTFAGGWWVSVGLYVCAVSLGGGRCPLLPFDPISFVLPKETVSSRQRKAPLKPPHHLGGPTRLSHLGVSPNGTNWCVKLVCTRWVDRALKSA